MEVPGHSQCSIAVYVPKLKALFPSDAAPAPVGGVARLTCSSPQYDLSLYKESLTKLASYEIDICAFEHYGVVTGNQAEMVIQNGLRETDEFEELVVRLYRQLGDIDETVEAVAAATSKKNKFDFLSNDMWSNVTRAGVRSALRHAKILD
jgi:glyoxylase-like metal-dependent hydrolase (beta-lactamase superfamily II)